MKGGKIKDRDKRFGKPDDFWKWLNGYIGGSRCRTQSVIGRSLIKERLMSLRASGGNWVVLFQRMIALPLTGGENPR
jgi:hypothetical protein